MRAIWSKFHPLPRPRVPDTEHTRDLVASPALKARPKLATSMFSDEELGAFWLTPRWLHCAAVYHNILTPNQSRLGQRQSSLSLAVEVTQKIKLLEPVAVPSMTSPVECNFLSQHPQHQANDQRATPPRPVYWPVGVYEPTRILLIVQTS